MLTVNTNEQLSEGDETPCSLYCKLTLGEDSPGSLVQGKPRDKGNPIHHSPTAPRSCWCLCIPTLHQQTHPSNAKQSLSPVPGRLQRGQSLWMPDLEFTCVWGEGPGSMEYICVSFANSHQEVLQMWQLWSKGFSHVPSTRYFRSKENRVNSCPRQNRKTFISINPSSPVLIFIFAFSDIPTPAGQTPDLIPVQSQMCCTWMGTLPGPGYTEKPAQDPACKQAAGWWVCPSQQMCLLWVPALQGAWDRAVFRDGVHLL